MWKDGTYHIEQSCESEEGSRCWPPEEEEEFVVPAISGRLLVVDVKKFRI